MFKIGWQVFRERLPGLVSRERRRRIALVGVVAAVVAFVGLVVLGVTTPVLDGIPLAPVGSVVVALLVAVGIGCTAAGCVPTGPKGWAVPPLPGIGWRTQEAIARYSRSNPPPLAPEHRDAVLDRLPENRDLLVRTAVSGLLLLAGGVAVLVALVVVTVAQIVSDGDVWRFPLFWLFTGFLGSASGIGSIRRLGRQEQLRVEAEALPPVPTPLPPRGRPGSPGGSKLALPEE